MITDIFIAVLLGLVGGSFITALSFRSGKGESVADGRSRCPKCGHELSWKDLFPLFSWLFLKGKCRYCSVPISIRYPLTEISTVIVFLLIYFSFQNQLQIILLCLISVFLIALFITDIETGLLPTGIIAILYPLGFIYRWQIGTDILAGVIESVACILFALFLRFVFFKLMKKESLGMGDVRFFGIIGLCLPYMQLSIYFFMSGVFGIITGIFWKRAGKGEEFPFGPALILALFICLLFPEISLL